MSLRRAGCVILCLLVASGARAQGVARDRPSAAPVPAGNGALGGRVISAEGAPVRRAQVTLTASDARVRQMATTDNEGRYTFTQLPAGRYTVRASKGGYVNVAFGQRAINQPIPPVILGAGESLSGLDIVLPRGSAVTGRVTDEFGDPVLQAQVQAMRFQFQADGERRLVPGAAQVMTDDLGQFRLFGLTPGEYVISATTRPAFMGMPGGRFTSDEPEEGYAPTFYPGTSNPAEAQPLTVGVGQELSVQIQLVPSRLSRISGIIVDSQGRPATPGTSVMFRQAATIGGSLFIRPGNVAPDGTFTISGVPPGDYVLEVRSRQGGRNAGGVPGNNEFAFVPLSVGGDVSGLRVVTGQGATLSGRVVFDGVPPPAGTRVRVVPQSADASRNVEPGRGNGDAGVIGPDGSFELERLAGPLFLRITIDGGRPGTSSDPLRYMTKSVLIDGVDVADVPFDPTRRGSVTGVTLVVTDKVTEVSGLVTDTRGVPLEFTTVLIVPEQLSANISPMRFVRLLQSDAAGKFSIRAMPAGRYAAVAVPALESGQQYDPAIIERARQIGRSFSLREGETVTLDLRVSSGF